MQSRRRPDLWLVVGKRADLKPTDQEGDTRMQVHRLNTYLVTVTTENGRKIGIYHVLAAASSTDAQTRVAAYLADNMDLDEGDHYRYMVEVFGQQTILAPNR